MKSTLCLLLFTFLFVGSQGSCCYNHACDYQYTARDRCFMDQAFAEKTNEGFCFNPNCQLFFLKQTGSCEKKKSVGEYCRNADGHYDNNYCVTGLCDDSTGKCEIRKSGCQSFSKCVGLQQAATVLRETFVKVIDTLPGSGEEGPENTMKLTNYKVDNPAEFALQIQYTKTIGGVTFKVEGKAYFPTVQPDVQADWETLKVVASVKLKLRWAFTVTIEGKGSLDQESTKMLRLTNGLDLCNSPESTTACIPHFFFRKPITFTFGPDQEFTVFLEVGVQLIAQMKYKVKADGSFKMQFGLQEQVIDFGKVAITYCGLDASCKPGVTTETPTVENNWIKTVSGSANATSEVNMRIGPEIGVRINGIAIGAGIMAHMDVQGAVTAATTSPLCVAGTGAFGFSVIAGLHVPAFSLGDALSAQCDSMYNQGVTDTVGEVGVTYEGIECLPPSGQCENYGGWVQQIVGKLTKDITSFDGTTQCVDLYTSDPLPFTVSGSKGSGCSVAAAKLAKRGCQTIEFESAIYHKKTESTSFWTWLQELFQSTFGSWW